MFRCSGAFASALAVCLASAPLFAGTPERGRDEGAAARELAAALAADGRKALEAGKFDEARERLEHAARLDPGEAACHLLLAALFFRRGELYEARQSLARALELAPLSADARELSGDLYYQEGQFERSRAEWEAALAAGGLREHALRMKLARLDREAGATSGFLRDVSRHFGIDYDGPVPAEVARTALRLLEEVYDRLWREFARPPQHEVPVVLYSRELFDRVTLSPGWVAGSYDGKIRVPVGGLQTAEDAASLAPILAHELTHAFVRANAPGQLPGWFEEGLAQHFQGATFEGARHEVRAQGLRFSTLDAVDGHLRGGPAVGSAYAAAALAVAELVRMDGIWLPRRILEDVAAGRAFPEAFHDSAGITLEEFQERWAASQE